MSITKDQNGNKSSKRVAGFCALIAGGVMGIILYIFSLFRVVADSATALTVIKLFLAVGGGLLGIGVAEFFAKKK